MNQQRQLRYFEAINEALDLCLKKDPNVFIIGEGVPDPKGIFGTTLGLVQKYGKDRVMDMPVSENGLTGICIGAALRGMRPVMTHQRVDFALLALDQIINNAAKWHFMFGGQQSVPLVVRLIIGCGWGQGAQHSQSLQALFAHIPGLKVVMPATAYDAKGLLISAIEDNNPVIFLEHRWLHGLSGYVPADYYKVPIGQAKIVKEGSDITIIANSYMTIEALRAVEALKKNNVSAELIDLRTIKPLDADIILKSVKKTSRVLVLDAAAISGGIAGEIIAQITEAETFKSLTVAPQRIALPDIPTPSSPGLTKNFYPNHLTIVEKVFEMLGRDKNDFKVVLNQKDLLSKPHDVPDLSFQGPF